MERVQQTYRGVAFDIDSDGLQELTDKQREFRFALIVGLIDAKQDETAKVQEYINEAEHQDGYEYWESYFTTVAQVVEDFELTFSM